MKVSLPLQITNNSLFLCVQNSPVSLINDFFLQKFIFKNLDQNKIHTFPLIDLF